MKKENKTPPTLLSFSFPPRLRGIKREGGFTLVELIIVITILAILATIAFLSFKGYMKDARDGNRIASISNIEKGLGLYNLETSKYPTPDKKDGQTLLQTGALSISGSIVEYSYLGEVGSGLTTNLRISKTPTDPLSGSKYTYTTTLDGRKYQIASILENPTSYKNSLVKQVNAGNDGYVAKVSGNHQDIVIKEFGTGKYITVVPSLVFDSSGSNILNQSGTLSIVNNKGNLPYSPSNSSNIFNTTTAEQLIKEIRNNDLAIVATLRLPDGVTLDGSGVLNGWWIPNVENTNWNGYSSGTILASLGAVGVNGGADYVKLTDVLNGGSANITAQTMTSAVVTPTIQSYDIGNSLRFNGSNQYLSKNFAGAGNQKIWTFSAWVKRSKLGTDQTIFGVANSSGRNGTEVRFGNDSAGGQDLNSLYFHSFTTTNQFSLVTKPLYRDTSNWMHLVVSLNTTATGSSDRAKIYIDGKEITDFYGTTTYPSSDYQGYINSSSNHSIGKLGDYTSGSNFVFNGYLSDINFIDSGALKPTSFGQFDTNGRWVPKSYTGSYGTNGFHLDFSSGASLTSLGLDSAPIEGNHTQANNWTLSPTFNTYDQMLDSPTNNFATLNPLQLRNKGYLNWSSVGSLSLGNLNYIGGYNRGSIGSISCKKDSKCYWETKYTTIAGASQGVGIGTSYALYNSTSTNSYFYVPYIGKIVYGLESYSTLQTGIPNVVSGDIIGHALDLVNNTYTLYKNGYQIGSSISVASDDYFPWIQYWSGDADVIDINFGQEGQNFIVGNHGPSAPYSDDGGIGKFYYQPPAGFKALSTKNITYPIENPKQHFDVLTYTGNGVARSLTGLQFKPDLVWLKNRTSSANHRIYDSIRGAGYQLYSDSTSQQNYSSVGLSSFNSDGFSLPNPTSDIAENTSSNGYVSWNWRAGGTAVTNNDGTIQSQVSVNKEAGFSIVSYTGIGSVGTVGHGLGEIPSLIIIKSGDGSWDWPVYHKDLGNTKGGRLNSLSAPTTETVWWNNTSPTGNVFTLGTQGSGNSNGNRNIAYVWSEIPGYSKFGSYTGNGSADGPFIYTGFKPKYLMIKRTDLADSWIIFDTERGKYNPISGLITGNTSDSETSLAGYFDALSNGFKIRVVTTASNVSGGTYIYASFAELPFK